MTAFGQGMNRDFYDSMLGDFLDESSQLLDRLNEHALRLDEWMCARPAEHTERCDTELLNEMFRAAHSLKGLSAMLGLSDFNQLTHRLENILDAARKGELYVRAACVELVFRAIDRLVALTEALRNDTGAESPLCIEITEQIADFLREAHCERQQSTQAEAEQLLASLRAAESPAVHVNEADRENCHRGFRIEERISARADAMPVGASTAGGDMTAGLADETPGRAAPAVGDDRRIFDAVDDTEVQERYLPIFVDEAELTLDRLSELLTAEQSAGANHLSEDLMVEWHRLKGSAASIGLKRVARMSHLVEDTLNELMDCEARLDAAVVDVVLACVDAVRDYVESLRTGETSPDRFEELGQRLFHVLPRGERPASPPDRPDDGACAAVPDTCSEEEDLAVITDALRRAVCDAAAERNLTDARIAIARVKFEPRLPLASLKVRLIGQRLAPLGELIYSDPPWEDLDSHDTLGSFAFGLWTSASLEEVKTQVWVAGVRSVEFEAMILDPGMTTRDDVRPPSISSESNAEAAPHVVAVQALASEAEDRQGEGTRPPDAAQEAASAPGEAIADSRKKPVETLRVEISRLDQLMNLTGQLAISKARFRLIGDQLREMGNVRSLLQTVGELRDTVDHLASSTNCERPPSAGPDHGGDIGLPLRRLQHGVDVLGRELSSILKLHESVQGLDEAVHQLERIAEGIQKGVMDTRMVPIGPLFQRFKRVVRDVTRSNGKAVRLIIRGETTELDKRMIDELGDPLIHLVRNAADHGIESAEERERCGKPREGTIILDAYHRGNNVFIEVADDGRGLDPNRIRDKALSRGLITAAEAERMSPSQLCQLIWEAGLSTAERVTEVSGRGMGMDIVKQKIEDINGTVDLTTGPNRGTRISIRLPLTLAILPSLMVDVCGDTFAIPVEAVKEIVRVSASDLPTVHGRRTAVLRDRVVSVAELADLLTWNRPMAICGEPDRLVHVVLLGDRGREIGLAVDHVLGEEDVVIKSMAENYQNVRGIAGACILGDGRVALILNVSYVMDAAAQLEVAP